MNHSLPIHEPTLDTCINAIYDHGQTVEDCLLRFPEQQKELEPLLRLAERLQSARALTAPVDMKVSARARMEERIRNQPQATATVLQPAPLFQRTEPFPAREQPSRRTANRAGRTLLPTRTTRVFAMALAILLLFLFANTTLTLANQAVPGAPLYGVKRAAEQAQLSLSPSEARQAHLHMRFADARLAEAKTLVYQGKAAQVEQALQEYRGELEQVQSYLDSERLPEPERLQIASQLAVQIQQDERELAMTGSSLARETAITPETLETIRQEIALAVSAIRDAYATVQQTFPDLPDVDWELLPFEITGTPSPDERTVTPTPRNTPLAQTGTPIPPVVDPEEGEPEWPTSSPVLPTGWPTQWEDTWATLVPSGTVTVHVPDPTLVATYLPPVLQTLIPDLPTPPPGWWPEDLPDPPDWPDDLPDPPDDPGDFPWP